MPYKINPFTGELDLVIDSAANGAVNQIDTDSGSATPVAGVINIDGGTGINTSGSGDTVTINLDDPVIVDNGGTGRTTLTDGAVLVGDGTNQVELVGPLTDGQLLIGDTAGVSPVASTLTAGTGISISNGAGSITIDADASTPLSFPTDSGTATPAANALTVSGSGLVDTAGSGSTVTINVESPVVVANGGTGATTLTDGGIVLGSGTGAVTVTSQPTNGQLLIGSTGLDPVLANITSTGSTITVSDGAGTINLETSDATANSFPTDAGTATPSGGALTIAGGTLIDSAGSGSTVTLNAGDTVVASVATDGSAATPSGNAFTIAGGTLLASSGSGATVTLDADDTVVASVGSDSGTATPSSNNFNIVGTNGITTSASTDTITIDGASISDFDWNVATGSTQAITVNNGYFANYAGTLAFTLPATAAVGDTIQIAQMAASQGWSLAQNAGQTCYIGNTATTTGAGGSLASTDDGDWIELVCRVANTDFQVNVKSGNITVV